MRWDTVIWFAVALGVGLGERHTIDDSLMGSNTINGRLTPVTTTAAPDTSDKSTTSTDVTTDNTLTTVAPKPTTTVVPTVSTTPTPEVLPVVTVPVDGGVEVSVPDLAPTTLAPTTPPEAEQREYVVVTTRGPVQGYPWQTNPEIIAYIDIPYASFQGHFQDPTPASAWENIHQVKEHNKRCPQLQKDIYVGDLDCLTLSIFTPSEAANASVLFHIHESNFVRGSGDPSIYGPEHFVSQGVIVVLPNYRLGPLGFLCLSNGTAPGNAALKDLTLALKWTSENIRAFGGDPTNIVVSGDGTSGSLVGYLTLAPGSNGYFTKSITESGSVLSPWALDRSPANTADAVAQRIRQISNPENTFAAADVRTIVVAARDIFIGPCVERHNRAFLSETPWSMLQNTVVNTTFIIGSASHAGAIEAVKTTEAAIEQMNKNFGAILPADLKFGDRETRSNIGNRVRAQYFGNKTITLDHVEELALCFTDTCYLGPSVRAARALSRAGARVFFYEFSFVGTLNRELDSINRPLNGTVRGDIVGYLFSQDGVLPAEGTPERGMVDLIMDLWISFIDNGTPSSGNMTWIELNSTTPAEESWLSLGEEVVMRRGVHEDRMRLWTSIYADHFIEHNGGFQDLPDALAWIVPFVVYVGLKPCFY